MFHGEFAEKDSATIPLPDKKYGDIRSFLLCIHPATLEDITNENVDILVPLVNEYQVSHLKTKCDFFLEKRICELDQKKHNGFRGKLVHYLLLAGTYGLTRTCNQSVQCISRQRWQYMKPEFEKVQINDKLKLEILTHRIEWLEEKTCY